MDRKDFSLFTMTEDRHNQTDTERDSNAQIMSNRIHHHQQQQQNHQNISSNGHRNIMMEMCENRLV